MWRGLFRQGIVRPRAAGRRHDAGALRVHDDEEHEDEDADADGDDVRWVGHRKGKGKGRFSRSGRGGRGTGRDGRSRFAPYGPAVTQSPPTAGGARRPRLCNVCWNAIMQCEQAQKDALIEAIRGRASARAYLVEEGLLDALDHGGDPVDSTPPANPSAPGVDRTDGADLADLVQEHLLPDGLVEDYVDRVFESADCLNMRLLINDYVESVFEGISASESVMIHNGVDPPDRTFDDFADRLQAMYRQHSAADLRGTRDEEENRGVRCTANESGNSASHAVNLNDSGNDGRQRMVCRFIWPGSV